jgi:hypothetical protein
MLYVLELNFTNFVKTDFSQENTLALHYIHTTKEVGPVEFLKASLFRHELLEILLQIAHHLK